MGHSQGELELGDVVGADEEGGLLLDHLSGGGGGRTETLGPKRGGGFYGRASEMRGNAVLSESSMYVSRCGEWDRLCQGTTIS